MNPNLIFDVGMHDGSDTAYYLHLGFNVVAIEADVDLAAAGQQRFKQAIDSGRLNIVNSAICEKRGEADFWICDELRIWNSFDKESASRNGMACHSVRVKTLPLSDLFNQYGVPYYLKIDIEGFDHIAAADITPSAGPEYVSMEISSVDDFYLLKSKGYQCFKCIQQGYFNHVLSPRLTFQQLFKLGFDRLKSGTLVDKMRNLYHRLRLSRYQPKSIGEWSFNAGSSGPFGEETPGPWLSFEEVLHSWLSQRLGHSLGYRNRPPGTSQWFDLHARRTIEPRNQKSCASSTIPLISA
jgi:FkbM family methyltransferase